MLGHTPYFREQAGRGESQALKKAAMPIRSAVDRVARPFDERVRAAEDAG